MKFDNLHECDTKLNALTNNPAWKEELHKMNSNGEMVSEIESHFKQELYSLKETSRS